MKKILIWGTGNIASEVYLNGINGKIQGFIETDKKKDNFYGFMVYGLDERWPDYDYIIVANDFSAEIYQICLERNICLDNIVFLRSLKKQILCNVEKGVLQEILGEKNYTNYCLEYGLYGDSFFGVDCEEYEKQNTRKNFVLNKNDIYPIIFDKYRKAGQIHNYFWQDLWAARLIKQTGVKRHFDIGSRIDGFIAHLLAMDIEVTMIDIREFPEIVDGLHTIVDDATLLREIPDDSIESMSALCSIEHFGLGRYGDPIDPEACFKCFIEIQNRMKKGGNLYISLPIGRERVEFNAHRVFYPSTLLKCFSNMDLVEFSCTAEGKIEYNVEIHEYDNDEHEGNYRYGLFHLRKK